MAQVSPALTLEVQNVETASWYSLSQPPTPTDSAEITAEQTTDGIFPVSVVGNPPSESGDSEPLTPTSIRGYGIMRDEGEIIMTSSPEQESPVRPSKRPRGSSHADVTAMDKPDLQVIPPKGKASSSSVMQQAKARASKITVTLEGADLWNQFYQAGTEMIITKSGRRMFPGIVVSVAGLESDSKYTITMEVNPADNHRYKYLNAKWVVVGKADAHSDEMVKYVHPDSPSSGRHWMANKVSFKKIKITNNRSCNKRGNVTLNSMHRYLPRVVISKCLSKKNTTIVYSQDLTECSFIAVTAYQNDRVTQLKIDHNPFAKAFRDNPNEHDMYSYPGMLGVWPPSSPLLSPSYPYSPDAQVPMQLSPGLLHSPLPQFSTAFGWDTHPYSPPAYRTPVPLAGLGPLPTPSAAASLQDPRSMLWNTTRLHHDSPPISPLLYSSTLYSNQAHHQGASVYQFHMSNSPVGYGPSYPKPKDHTGTPQEPMMDQ